jgi:hypothetical protein
MHLEWWHLWVGLAVALSFLGAATREMDRANALAIIVLGITSVQVLQEFLAAAPMWVAACMVWIVAGDAVQRQSSGKLTLTAVLLVMSGLCIPLGRFAGEVYGIGSKALLFSDVFGASALAVLGGPILAKCARGIADRIRGLGLSGRPSHLGSNLHTSNKP